MLFSLEVAQTHVLPFLENTCSKSGIVPPTKDTKGATSKAGPKKEKEYVLFFQFCPMP